MPTNPVRPDRLILRAYQVGFGDCFLLTFHYPPRGTKPEFNRHVLIDFGSTALPKNAPSGYMKRVADDIAKECGGKLHAVIAIGGFFGFGAKLISMPLDDLQITSNDNTPQVRIAMTGDQLQQLVDSRPEFRYERQVAQGPAKAPRS